MFRFNRTCYFVVVLLNKEKVYIKIWLLCFMIRSKENLVGARAFLIGVVLALVAGVLGSSYLQQLYPIILAVLVILGLGVGLINVSPYDVNKFLLASVSLVIVSFAGSEAIKNVEFLSINIGRIVSSTLVALLILLVPATIVVAIKSLFSISQN